MGPRCGGATNLRCGGDDEREDEEKG